MTELDLERFYDALDALAEIKDKKLSSGAKLLWFRAMERFELSAVLAALSDCLMTFHAMPQPADVVNRLMGALANDGRPGPEEAWGLSEAASDERCSVVWTDECAQAFAAVAELLHRRGDHVAARRGFLERYQQLVQQSRMRGEAVRWVLSAGSDALERKRVVVEAVQLGRLTEQRALALLPPGESLSVSRGESRLGLELQRAVAAMLIEAKREVSPAERDAFLRGELRRLRSSGLVDLPCPAVVSGSAGEHGSMRRRLRGLVDQLGVLSQERRAEARAALMASFNRRPRMTRRVLVYRPVVGVVRYGKAA